MASTSFRSDKTGERIVESLKMTLKTNLLDNLNCRIVQTGTKLSTRFNIKDAVDKQHFSNFIYKRECRNKKCKESYIGETARRRIVRTSEHGGKDHNSWIFKHSSSTKLPRAKDEDFEILASNSGGSHVYQRHEINSESTKREFQAISLCLTS